MFWWRQHTSELTKWQQQQENLTFKRLSQREFTKQLVGPSRVQPGFLYFYNYDPKLKRTLPHYDTFPLVLVLAVYEDRFLGLNFHYLDYYHRARLFDMLYPFREGRASRPTVRDIRMRLKVSYSLLKLSSKYRPFKPCLKAYLMGHLTTPCLKVGAREWDLALFLPVERFVKKTKQQVWRNSRQMF